LDAELVERVPVIAGHVRPVHQAHAVTACLVALLVLHGNPFDQPAVHLPVGGDEARDVRVAHHAQRFVLRAGGDVRVQSRDGSPQAVRQHHVAIPVALGAGRLGVEGRNIRPVPRFPAQRGKPLQGGSFEVVFGDALHARFAIK